MDIELSIVMPCLNEAETLETCIRKAQTFLAKSGVSGEIVIGDNGSIDGSQEIARRLGARVIDVPVRGYGAALYWAIAASHGRFCIMGDSDDSYDFLNLEPFLNELRSGADLVMGNRFRGGIAKGAMPWKNRYIGNPALSSIGRLLFRSPAKDFHCGIRGFSKDAFERMDLRTTGMEFASEMVIKATLMKMRISEVPTTLSPDGRSRPPHLRPFRDGWRHLRFMFLFSPNWLFFYPGLVLTLAGLLIGATLLAGPISVNGVRFGIHTLIYCSTAIEIGVQAVLFSLLSRAYAVQEGLLPARAGMARVLGAITLERALLLGTLLFLIGLGLMFYAVGTWEHTGFGVLEADNLTRWVVLSSLTLSMGLQITLVGLLLSTLRLSVRPLLSPEAIRESLSRPPSA